MFEHLQVGFVVRLQEMFPNHRNVDFVAPRRFFKSKELVKIRKSCKRRKSLNVGALKNIIGYAKTLYVSIPLLVLRLSKCLPVMSFLHPCMFGFSARSVKMRITF